MTEQTDSATPAELLARAQAMRAQLVAWRREIHRWPELTFTENRTAGLVNAVLTDLGLETETEVAKTGVVGYIRGGGGPTVGLRADMDALPILEENGSDFDSTRPGIMHACGHDAHTAILMGAATLLKGLADEGRLPGTIRLLFQPSEEAQDNEGKSGAMRMVEEGALDGLDAVFGLHVTPALEVGTVGTHVGPMQASADEFQLVLRGHGGHAADPHETVDPIALSGLVINAIHQIVSRRIDPMEKAVITIGTIDGGTADNIIPDSVVMTGTIRAYTPEVRAQLHDELRKAVRVVESEGATPELEILLGYPPTVCSPIATAVMNDAMRTMLGDEKLVEVKPSLGAEDFSYMAQKAPGNFLRLGVKSPEWTQIYPVHRADFRMDEDALPIGSAALAAAALEWMKQKS